MEEIPRTAQQRACINAALLALRERHIDTFSLEEKPRGARCETVFDIFGVETVAELANRTGASIRELNALLRWHRDVPQTPVWSPKRRRGPKKQCLLISHVSGAVLTERLQRLRDGELLRPPKKYYSEDPRPLGK